MKTKEIYEKLTGEIITSLEQGARPWQKPWISAEGGLPTRANGQHYKGINILLLWARSMQENWASNRFATYKQIRDLGGQVNKGEKGTMICFFKPVLKNKNEPDETKHEFYPCLRTYSVFNAEQAEGLPENFYPEPLEEYPPTGEFPDIVEYFDLSGINQKLKTGGKACYSPSSDIITMPKITQFEKTEFFYSVLAHEAIHLTGHKGRLDRFKDDHLKYAYAREELIAELGSAFLCAQFGIRQAVKEESDAYLANWISTMKKEPKFLFQVASAAQKATEFLNNLKASRENLAESRAA